MPDRVARLRRGEVVVAPVAPAGMVAVPGGLIHHWIGAVFIPGASLDDLFSVVHDYDHYKQFYKPVVADSRTLACTASDQKFSMVWQNHILFVNAAVQGQYEAHDTLLGGDRAHSSDSTVTCLAGHAGSQPALVGLADHLASPDTGGNQCRYRWGYPSGGLLWFARSRSHREYPSRSVGCCS